MNSGRWLVRISAHTKSYFKMFEVISTDPALCQIGDLKLLDRVGECNASKQAQLITMLSELGPPDKGHAIIGLAVFEEAR